jgi:hypothetical protein
MSVPYVHSNYERRDQDHYPTIDSRCVHALVETWNVCGMIADCCAPQGSGIVDELRRLGYDAHAAPEVTGTAAVPWIVTNPPYDLRIVDQIAGEVVARLERGFHKACAFLMRANWDLAARRAELFASPLYRGQTRMRFRPYWSEERKASPIHSYVWHVWAPGEGEPVIRYWPRAS